ncbi:MAG TPA: ABC transporter permease [Methanocella sp.]|nr:ABC transporter permease [Methanocella sp.]
MNNAWMTIGDIYAIAWKEYRELFAAQGSFRSRLLNLGIFTLLLGFYFPFAGGHAFFQNPYILLFYIFFPLGLMIVAILDSIAGERERHTLETLLASRLSDYAILYGKILTEVAYSWGLTVGFILLALVAVNIAFWSGNLALFPLLTLLFTLVAALMIDLFAASAGIIISLKMPTVRSGNDILVMALIVVAITPLLVYSILPVDWQKWIADVPFHLGMVKTAGLILMALMALDLCILWVAAQAFRRSRLIQEL